MVDPTLGPTLPRHSAFAPLARTSFGVLNGRWKQVTVTPNADPAQRGGKTNTLPQVASNFRGCGEEARASLRQPANSHVQE